jgi:branched-chain amino acid aminotransferase
MAALPTFAIEPNQSPAPVAERTKRLADPGFGTLFTDHMVVIKYTDGKGWHDAKVTARAPIPLDPAAAVLHYAQEIFEGLKAYRRADGTMAAFRPDANARRFRESAKRLAMPELPDALFIQSLKEIVKIDRDWYPSVEGGSLYLRPFMFASEVFLGVRPAKEYLYLVIVSPVGGYFKSGAAAVSLFVSQDYTRAAPGGTGAAKCGGNYAASLAPTMQAFAAGHDQVVFLDAVERKWIEELGGMNLFFVFDDGSLVTPPLSGTILPGITRDALLTLARTEGLKVREERFSIDQWRDTARSGRLTESFACGTAAVITPIGKVTGADYQFTVGSGGPGQTTQRLKQRLVDIQRGLAPDRHGWVQSLE